MSDDEKRNDVLEHIQIELESIAAKLKAAINQPPRLLDTERAGLYAGLSESYMVKLRNTLKGPKYLKIGGNIRYDIGDLDKWINEHQRHG